MHSILALMDNNIFLSMFTVSLDVVFAIFLLAILYWLLSPIISDCWSKSAGFYMSVFTFLGIRSFNVSGCVNHPKTVLRSAKYLRFL